MCFIVGTLTTSSGNECFDANILCFGVANKFAID